MSPTELAYRKTAAAAGATGLGLLIAMYDTLAGNLHRAAQAERSNDLEKRSTELNHALMVIAFLEDRVRRGNGGELADQLNAFYATLRSRMIEAQVKRSPEILEEQMTLVLNVRATWQEIELRSTPAPEVPRWVPEQSYPGAMSYGETGSSSWSA